MPDKPTPERRQDQVSSQQRRKRRITLARSGERHIGPVPRHEIWRYTNDVVVESASIGADDDSLDSFQHLREKEHEESEIADALRYKNIDTEFETESQEERLVLSKTQPARDFEQRQILSITLANMIERAENLEESGNFESAIDFLLDSLDELFRRGQFALCDSILIETNIEVSSTRILFTLIKATACAKSDLATRSEFVKHAKQVLEGRGELRRDALDRLE